MLKVFYAALVIIKYPKSKINASTAIANTTETFVASILGSGFLLTGLVATFLGALAFFFVAGAVVAFGFALAAALVAGFFVLVALHSLPLYYISKKICSKQKVN